MEKQLNSGPHSPVTPKGLVQVYTGDGKGKTTAAIGNIIRALGHNLKVYVCVFMKGDYTYGEWDYLARFPDVKIERFGLREFCDPANIKPEEKEQATQALNAAREAMLNGDYDLIVLDEINIAVAWHLIDINDVIKFIDDKPAKVNLILTGRYADTELVKKADLVTEMLKIKHHYDTGITARQGIEF